MRIVIIGGGLQGVEAAWLSQKAGFEVVVVDKNAMPAAKGVCHSFIQADITQFIQVPGFLKKADFILPALENMGALTVLDLWQRQERLPICFDLDAYKISSSKLLSNALFARLDIARPAVWPNCPFPLVMKPSVGSGSHGVTIIPSPDLWPPAFDPHIFQDQWVMEEYLQGPSYSLEIIGRPGFYETLTVTQILVDEQYDCRQVVAPATIDPSLVKDFERSAKTIAREMGLTGIMDFEVILHQGKLKMLEIDARFPSQTPIAVWAATGKNMIPMLANLTLGKARADSPLKKVQPPGHVALLHICVTPQGIRVQGENIMKSCGPLHVETQFFGADEAITSYEKGCHTWVATLIIQGKTVQEMRKKRAQVLKNLGRHFDLPLMPDINPDSESFSPG